MVSVQSTPRRLRAMSSSKPDGPTASEHWSDGELSALVEAWGQLHLHCNRGSFRVGDGRQVCDAVNAHRAAAGCLFDRSLDQCQWRIYALKSQYKKELAKGQPTSGWSHFAQLRAFLAGPDDSPPPGFAAKMPSASVKGKEVVEKASDGASGSVGRKTVPVKRHVSSLRDILDRSGGPAPGFPPRMPATAKKQKEEVKEEEEVEREHGAASGGCNPAMVVTELAAVTTAVVTKLAEVYERLEMEKMAMEREKRAAKMEGDNLGETQDN